MAAMPLYKIVTYLRALAKVILSAAAKGTPRTCGVAVERPIPLGGYLHSMKAPAANKAFKHVLWATLFAGAGRLKTFVAASAAPRSIDALRSLVVQRIDSLIVFWTCQYNATSTA
jgi:hypothetical protein